MKKRMRVLCVAVAAVFLQAGVGAAQAGLNLSTSQSYIMGYRVEGNFVLPIMGTVQNGVFMGVPNGESTYQQPGPDGSPGRRGKQLDRFFSEPQIATWVNEDKKPTPPPIAPASPVITGQIRLNGILRVTFDGRPCLVVSSPTGETQYDLSVNEHLKESLPNLGEQLFRGHLTGIITRGTPRPSFFIQSGWFEPM